MKPANDNSYSLLIDIGLSKSEAMIYTALLESGQNTVLGLSRITNLNRITIYNSIEELIGKGLVLQSSAGKKKMLIAATPEKLRSILEVQEQELNDKKEIVGDLINDLYKNLNKVKDQTDSEVKYYEGYSAVAKLYDEVLSSTEVRAIVNSSAINKVFPENMNKFIDALNSGTKVWNILTVNNHKPSFVKLADTFHGYNYKFLPADLDDFGAIDYLLFQGNIVMIEAGRAPKAIKIKNDVFYKLSEQMYKLLWRLI